MEESDTGVAVGDSIPIEEKKRCKACFVEKPLSDFQKSNRQDWCKDCYNSYQRANYKKKHGTLLPKIRHKKMNYPVFQAQSTTIQKVVYCLLEDPEMPKEEIAKRCDIKPNSLNVYFWSNPYLKALRLLAGKKLTNMIPKAIRGFSELLNSADDQVRLKAVTEILKSENILGPEKVSVDVNDLRSMPEHELRQLVHEATKIPSETIEGELIS